MRIIKPPMKKQDLFYLCTEIINSFSFYTFLMSQNYIIKSTSQIYVFSTIFIPTTIYSFIKFSFTHKLFDFGFKEIFYGMCLGSLDFLFYYMLFIYMLNNSTFLVLFLTGLPCLLLFFPILLPDLICNGIYTYLMFCVLDTVANFELYGMNKNHEINSNLYTGHNNQYQFILIIYLLRTVFYTIALKETEYKNLQTANIFFISFFSCIFICINKNLRVSEAKNINSNLYIPTISLLIYICTYRFYNSFIFFICFFTFSLGYFFAPTFWFFLVNRTEMALYFVYLSLFVIFIFLYMYESTSMLKQTDVMLNDGEQNDMVVINSTLESEDDEESLEVREITPYSSV